MSYFAERLRNAQVFCGRGATGIVPEFGRTIHVSLKVTNGITFRCAVSLPPTRNYVTFWYPVDSEIGYLVTLQSPVPEPLATAFSDLARVESPKPSRRPALPRP